MHRLPLMIVIASIFAIGVVVLVAQLKNPILLLLFFLLVLFLYWWYWWADARTVTQRGRFVLRHFEVNPMPQPQCVKNAGYDPQKVYDCVWGKHLADAEYEDRPLSKLTKDILDLLEIK